MKTIPYKLLLAGLVLFATALLTWSLLRPDPHQVFLREVGEMIKKANEGKHLALRENLSPEMEAYIADNFMSVQQALAVARKLDFDRKILYRVAEDKVFRAGEYAEIEIERSGPGGDFSKPVRFSVPFIYRDKAWWVAGGFEDERRFINPLR